MTGEDSTWAAMLAFRPMNTAKKICERDEQGLVHVDVRSGRPGQRVEDGDLERHPEDNAS